MTFTELRSQLVKRRNPDGSQVECRGLNRTQLIQRHQELDGLDPTPSTMRVCRVQTSYKSKYPPAVHLCLIKSGKFYPLCGHPMSTILVELVEWDPNQVTCLRCRTKLNVYLQKMRERGGNP